LKGLVSVAAAALLVVAVIAGCGSSKSAVRLDVTTHSTNGKALVFTAATNAKYASGQGSLYALELRGFDSGTSGASFEHPTYTDPNRCVGGRTCQWTVAPGKAGDYQYKVFVLDLIHNKTAGESNAVKLSWAAPPHPESITLSVNGKTPPSVPLSADHYSEFASGPMQVQANWKGDAAGTGYYVTIGIDDKVYAKCSTGTSCTVPKKIPLPVGEETSWVVQLNTTKGNKVTGGFKTCLKGVAKQKKA
jgi:hypothetical protein